MNDFKIYQTDKGLELFNKNIALVEADGSYQELIDRLMEIAVKLHPKETELFKEKLEIFNNQYKNIRKFLNERELF